MNRLILETAAVLVLAASAASAREPAAPCTVDFRFSPPQWQVAICLPDDPQKSLVDKDGALLYHYGHGKREFGTRIALEFDAGLAWQKQELLSPRVPIVRTHLAADGLQVVEDALAVTDPPPAGTPRGDLILVHVTNTSATARMLSPKLVLETTREFHTNDRQVAISGGESIQSSLKITGPTSVAGYPWKPWGSRPANRPSSLCFTLAAERSAASRRRSKQPWPRGSVPCSIGNRPRSLTGECRCPTRASKA